MIKIYVDWNVMSGMKNGRFQELQEILRNRQKFLPIYSTSHIGDIYSSISDVREQEQRVIEDLDFISRFTDNWCIYNDFKDIHLEWRDPGELLDNRIEEAPLFSDFSIDSLLKPVEGDDMLTGVLETYKNFIKAIPIEESLKQAYADPNTAETMDRIFPGLRDDMSMNGFFKSFGKMYQDMNNTESYKELREIVQKVGVNSSHFNENKNPFDVIDKGYSKLGIEGFSLDKYVTKGKNAPEWFDEITNEYLALDMHGYKADKIKVSAKEKSTFKNTTEDSFHTAFASRCDFYITDDDRNYKKTKAVYEKLNIYTKVFKPAEFIEHYKRYLNYHTFDEHFENLSLCIREGKNFHPVDDDEGNFFGWISFSDHFFFNFFNKITVPKSENAPYFLLTKEHPANTYIITQTEINACLRLFLDKFGNDFDDKGEFDPSEFDGQNCEGRKWMTSRGELKIVRLNGWFQMYLYLSSENEVGN